MVEIPPIRKGPPPNLPSENIAKEADIPKPPPEAIRQEEMGSQLQKFLPKGTGNLPPNIHEVIRLIKSLEQEGKKVKRNTSELMNYLKHGDGSELSADLLVATATMMAAIPKKQKEKKKRLRDLYFRWARQTSTSLITRVISTFKKDK